MSNQIEHKRILLIDRQASWRERSRQALKDAGFEVSTLDHYSYHPDTPNVPSPNLVILGCASIGPEEMQLILQILASHIHLLVLSTALPWKEMRALFLVGADDVADKPYNPEMLISIVRQLFESIE
jgi:DNA-binding response OmpR family regulator